MTLVVSGDLDTTRELKQRGIPTRYSTIWIVPESRLKDGRLPDLDAHIAACRTAGTLPHVQAFLAGDENSEAFWAGAVTTKRGMNLGKWWEVVKAIGATLAKERGIVTLEAEWFKGNLQDGAPAFDAAWSDAAHTIRRLAPNVEVVNCPGEWAPGVQVRTRYPKMLAATRVWGVQNLRGLTRDAPAHYEDGPSDLLARVEDYALTFGKPIVITDLAYSTYGLGGGGHPFRGGDGTAADNLQAAAFQDLARLRPEFERLGVTDLIIRGLHDDDGNEAEHYGEAESHWGFVRRDGSRKTAFDALLQLARTTPTAEEYAAVVSERDGARSEVAALQARIDAARLALGKP